jgi:hypothetical protein
MPGASFPLIPPWVDCRHPAVREIILKIQPTNLLNCRNKVLRGLPVHRRLAVTTDSGPLALTNIAHLRGLDRQCVTPQGGTDRGRRYPFKDNIELRSIMRNRCGHPQIDMLSSTAWSYLTN